MKLPTVTVADIRRYAPYAGAAVLVIAALGTAVHFFRSSSAPVDAQQAAREEVARLVAAVGKLYQLPTDETPVVATVADPAKLASQPFFKNAKKGDKVLIYNVAQKAILYDPVANILVEVAPLSAGAQSTVPH